MAGAPPLGWVPRPQDCPEGIFCLMSWSDPKPSATECGVAWPPRAPELRGGPLRDDKGRALGVSHESRGHPWPPEASTPSTRRCLPASSS